MTSQAPVASRPQSPFEAALALPRRRLLLGAAYAALIAGLIGFAVRLVTEHRTDQSELADLWFSAAFELAASIICLGRGLALRRAAPLLLGAGVLSWAVGDVVLAVETARSGAPSQASLADVFYLGFYPLTYAAVVLVIRRQLGTVIGASWLDGAVAGLGAAALCACFAFQSIVHALGGDATTAAINLAYPAGDVLLFGLVVGGSAILPNLRSPQWLLLASACALNAVGDTANLLQSAEGYSLVATILDALAWPSSILLISMSVWLRPGRSNPMAPYNPPGFTLPALGALSGLVILVVATLRHVDTVALSLATATLVTVGLRLALSLRGLRVQTEERQRQAVTDELTGLGNRRRLFQVLDSYFEQLRNGNEVGELAFLFVDLNKFKEVNDSFGHAAGDELLRQLGPRLSGTLRDHDLVVRLGGDEFGVVLMDTETSYGPTVAERLTHRLNEPFVLEGNVEVRLSASIGIANAPADARDSAGLVRQADVAMYRAKVGKSSFQIYTHQLDDGRDRLRLVEDLRAALREEQFVLHYQPQVDLQTGEMTAVEALVRWVHPSLGVIPPLEFLPLAEEAGLMPSLTKLVLNEAVAQCARWREAGHRFAVSVNVSAPNILETSFTEIVSETLSRHQMPPSALILEVTETSVITNLEECKSAIDDLRQLGVEVSIDDFGAGFTSLAYLAGLPATELKLDRMFIRGLARKERQRDRALVRGTIELGHALGMRVVAEGIEDEEILTCLADLGCDVAQGYFISRPVPASDMRLQATRPLEHAASS